MRAPDRLATLYNQAMTDLKAGRVVQAETGLRQARELLLKRRQQQPTNLDVVFFLAMLDYNLGNLLSETNRAQEARQLYEVVEQILGPVVARDAAPPGVCHLLAQSQFNLGNVLLRSEAPAQAVRHLRTARELWEPLARAYPDKPQYRNDLARAHFNYALALTYVGDHENAISSYRLAQPIWEQLLREQGTGNGYRYDLGRSHFNLGMCCRHLGQVEQAGAAFEEAVAHLTRLGQAQPDAEYFDNLFAIAVEALSESHHALGRAERANAAWIRYIGFLVERYAARRDEKNLEALGQGLLQQAGMLARIGHVAGARIAYERAVVVWTERSQLHPQEPGPLHVLGSTYLDLGNLLCSGQHWDAAQHAYGKALDAWTQLPATDPDRESWRATGHYQLGNLSLATGQLCRAEAEYEAALAIRDQVARHAPDDQENLMYLGGTLGNLGHVLRMRGRYPDALAHYDRALSLLARAHPPQHRAELREQFLKNVLGGRAQAANRVRDEG